MLLVFRQHRLALSATGGASATLPALVQAPARLRANVRAVDRDPQAKYCGAALRVSSGNGSFAFLLQAFSFSNKKENAEML